ncbi:MAG: HemK family protein methyltransferase [Candidatus Dojkabacteria bacterium]|nr:HemK family protein methyltransferase [Candidatus Dojkabacteria bacterium]
MENKRKLSPRETNHLIKFGIDPFSDEILDSGEIPVEYLTGLAEFYERDFVVSKETLIPRIETEQMVDIALEFLSKKKGKMFQFVDIGTGSGAIGITLALELRKKRIKYIGSLTDVSNDALSIAKKNVSKFKVDLKIRESNLLDSFSKFAKFDLILANLPYIPTERINNLDNSVKIMNLILH